MFQTAKLRIISLNYLTLDTFMKDSMIKSMLIAAIIMLTGITGYAQQSDDVDKAVKDIMEKYDTSTGVESTVIEQGSGLGFVKMMLKKEFGKEFMKGVTSITIIDYSNASNETCKSLHNDLNSFLSLLEEFKISDKKEFSDNDFIRCFAASSSPGVLSHFIIALEKEKSRTIMHMAGKIVAGDFK